MAPSASQPATEKESRNDDNVLGSALSSSSAQGIEVDAFDTLSLISSVPLTDPHSDSSQPTLNTGRASSMIDHVKVCFAVIYSRNIKSSVLSSLHCTEQFFAIIFCFCLPNKS
jgi:hypothetical protein